MEGAAMYRKIVVGYDGSEQARDALALASRLRADDGVVIAACVYPATGPGRGQQLEAVLADAARETLAGAREQTPAEWLELRPVRGRSPAHGLHIFSEQAQTDLVVVGSAHRGKIGQLLAGSTGERLLHGSSCPVALAPRGFPAGAARPRVIGVAYDGSGDAATALREAAELASELGATLKLITVLPPLDVFTTGALYAPHHTEEEVARYRRAEFGQMLEDAAEPLADELRAATVLAEGRAADQIVAEARKDVDLLVMGSRSYGPLRRVTMGSTAIEVMRLAPCPVIVVPRGAATPSVEASPAATATA
jgi:nucleotide-binding universal stress UspA family protein